MTKTAYTHIRRDLYDCAVRSMDVDHQFSRLRERTVINCEHAAMQDVWSILRRILFQGLLEILLMVVHVQELHFVIDLGCLQLASITR